MSETDIIANIFWMGFWLSFFFKIIDCLLDILFKLQDDFWYWRYFKKTGDDFEEKFKLSKDGTYFEKQ